MTEVGTTCPLCEATCGLKITVRDGQPVAVRGDPDDPRSLGYLCRKGPRLLDLHHDPARLRQPIVAGQPAGWDRAIDSAAAALATARRDHGPDSVAFYTGNPVAHDHGALLGCQLLKLALQTRWKCSASTLDQRPKEVANQLLYGNPLRFAVPDLDRTDLIVLVGANPVVSQGSLAAAPRWPHRLAALRARGGRIVVIDPRRTETAAMADAWLPVKPGSDPWWLAAVARQLLALGATAAGSDRLRSALARFTPEVAAQATGLEASAIVALAHDLYTADRAVVYGRLGTCTQRFGTLASWAIDAVNLLTGNLDRVGGAMFPDPALPVGLMGRRRWHGRDGRVLGERPVAALLDAIEAGQVRALLCVAGNPVLSVPGGDRLGRALDRLDAVVVVDPRRSETAAHAHYVLPPTSALERDRLELALPGVALRDGERFSPAVVPPAPDTRSDWGILAELAWRIARHRRLIRSAPLRIAAWAGPDAWASLLFRLGPTRQGLAAVRAMPRGRDRGSLQPGRLRRSVRLDAPEILEELAALAATPLPAESLVLIGRRTLATNNSWMTPTAPRRADATVMLIHPDDADAHGLVDGSWARVTSAGGSLVVPIRIDAGLRPGVVSLPHSRSTASSNDLVDPRSAERLTGTAVYATEVALAPVDPPATA